MTTQVSATLVNGMFLPDEAVAIRDQTRVRLTIEPLTEQTAGAAAWEAIKARLHQRPIHAAGLRYSRDELHERR